jgi:hypothetical protein
MAESSASLVFEASAKGAGGTVDMLEEALELSEEAAKDEGACNE